MIHAEEMRRLITLIETEQLTEIGRVGRAIGAAAMGLSAMAGGANVASAQTPQATVSSQISQPSMDAKWDQVAQSFQSIPQDLRDKVLAKIGTPDKFVQNAKAQGTTATDAQLLDNWMSQVAKVTVDLQASPPHATIDDFWNAEHKAHQQQVNPMVQR